MPLNDDMPHLPPVHSGVITPTDYHVFGGAELSVTPADAAVIGETDSLTLTIGVSPLVYCLRLTDHRYFV